MLMQIPEPPHSWSLSAREAIAVQIELAGRVELRDPGPIRKVAGVDCAFAGERCLSAVVVWDLERAEVIETRTAAATCPMPYIPGLLSFRELPAVLEGLAHVESSVDAVLCDGQGLAHPRRFGLACHLGVILGLPTAGCAKSRLVGTYRMPARRRGSSTRLLDRGEVVGRVVRTRDGVRPVFVSPGHRMSIAAAERLVLRCGRGYRLPEPTRLADHRVADLKRAEQKRAPASRRDRPNAG